jgi:hypothetical protein
MGFHEVRILVPDSHCPQFWKTTKAILVRLVRSEPTLLSEPDFESGASTSSSTPVETRPKLTGAAPPEDTTLRCRFLEVLRRTAHTRYLRLCQFDST